MHCWGVKLQRRFELPNLLTAFMKLLDSLHGYCPKTTTTADCRVGSLAFFSLFPVYDLCPAPFSLCFKKPKRFSLRSFPLLKAQNKQNDTFPCLKFNSSSCLPFSGLFLTSFCFSFLVAMKMIVGECCWI